MYKFSALFSLPSDSFLYFILPIAIKIDIGFLSFLNGAFDPTQYIQTTYLISMCLPSKYFRELISIVHVSSYWFFLTFFDISVDCKNKIITVPDLLLFGMSDLSTSVQHTDIPVICMINTMGKYFTHTITITPDGIMSFRPVDIRRHCGSTSRSYLQTLHNYRCSKQRVTSLASHGNHLTSIHHLMTFHFLFISPCISPRQLVSFHPFNSCLYVYFSVYFD